MDATITNPLVIRLKSELQKREISLVDFQAATGIKKDRVYKWFNSGFNPKAEDADKIEKWLNGDMEEVPKEVAQKASINDSMIVILERLSLSLEKMVATREVDAKTMDKLADSRLLDSQTISYLTQLLGAKAEAPKHPLPAPGTKGTETLKQKTPAKSGAQIQ